MLSVSRLDFITEKITALKFVSVEELSVELDVSGETIRRDLRALEEKGILNRIYGGAYLVGSRESDVSVQVRRTIMLPSKEKIAELCAQMIQPDDTVFLDSSTTSLEIAKRIAQMPVTVITHSLLIISYLSEFRNVRIVALGGVLDTVNMCFTGKTTLNNMREFYARKAFVSCRTISEEYGVMDSNEQISQVRSAAIQNCSWKCLVADNTKLGSISLYKIADFEKFDAIAVDEKPNDDWLEIFSQNQIEVFYPGGVIHPEPPEESG